MYVDIKIHFENKSIVKVDKRNVIFINFKQPPLQNETHRC